MKNNIQVNQAMADVELGNYILKIIAEQTFEDAVKDVEESDFSAEKMKSLTSDIMQDVSKQATPQLMLTIAKTVRKWNNDESKAWKSDLKEYVRLYENIRAIYVSQRESNTEFVIIVNDVLLDEVLTYNEFCFCLMDKYSNIDNFYIFDRDEYENMNFVGYNKIYQRG